ncbi:MAG: hypothetical protein ACFE9Z_17425 [Promethearchaeota archaeon]
MEHFSRKTSRNVTDLIIVTDPSKMGIHTFKRIVELSKEVELKFENIWILGNRVPNDLKNILEKEIEDLNEEKVHLLGFIPNDDEISKINMIGGSLLSISNENPSYQQAKEIFAKIV